MDPGYLHLQIRFFSFPPLSLKGLKPHQHTIALISIQLYLYTSAVPGKLLRDLPPEDVSGPKLPCMVALCSSLRHTLEAVFRARGERKAALYKLQVTSCSTNGWLQVYKDLGYPIPVASMSNQAMERASKNLQGFDLFAGIKDSRQSLNLDPFQSGCIGTVVAAILPSWLTNSSNAPSGQSDFRRLIDWAKHLEEVSSAGREAMKHATIGFSFSRTMGLWSLSGKLKKL